MMEQTMSKPCRKCRTPNPQENVYCRKCGAVLGVATALVRAQRKPIKPLNTGMRWRHVFIGVFVMLGIAAVFIAIATIFGLQPTVGQSATGRGILNLALTALGLFIVAFFLGGVILARLSKQPATRESVLASVLAVLMLGVVGSVMTIDLLIAAAVALLPSIGAAWLGARISGLKLDADMSE
jgi:magnesium-transporting ATPase (P-type)